MKFKTTMKNMAYVFVGVILAKCIGCVTSIYLAKTLQPDNYGHWLTLILIVSYSGLFHLGTIESLVKQYPYLLGKGEPYKALEVEENVFGSVLVSALAMIVIGVALIYSDDISARTGGGLIPLMVVTAAFILISTFYYQRLTAHQLFRFTSMIDVSRAVSSLIFLVMFTYKWGLVGTVWGFLTSEAFVFILSAELSRRQGGRISPDFNRRTIADLIRIGFPITVTWWMYTFQATVDRIIAMSMLGKSATGYYGLGVSIVSALILIPQAIGYVLYPKISNVIGKNFDQNQLATYVISPARIISFMMALIIGPLILVSPYIYEEMFPLYLPGLESAVILLHGAFFICLIKHGANYLIADNKQLLLLGYTLICLLLKVVTTLALVMLGSNIVGIAISSVITSALLTSLIWKNVFQSVGYNVYDQYREMFYLYVPFMLMVLLIAIIKIFVVPYILITAISLCYLLFLYFLLFALVLAASPNLNKRVRELTNMIGSNSFERG